MKNKNAAIYNSYITELEKLLKESANQKNPAYWLHLNKARTPLFMLESITRLLNRSTDDEFVKPAYKLYKKLEDLLGQIDYYDAFINQFKANKTIKKVQITYLEKKLKQKTAKLNSKLKKYNFFVDFLEEFRANTSTDFNDKGLLIAFNEQIKTEILSAEEFFSRYPNGFTEFEEQIHTLRRKLRWISIYGVSLAGIIALKDPHKKYSWEKEFVTENDLASRFNKLTVKKGVSHYIYLNKKAFFALSHVIAKLGEIKDKGLGIEILEKALKKTRSVKTTPPRVEARRLLKLKDSEEKLLKEAYDLLYRFFVDYKIHIELITV